ncbi:MAG: class I tRNA ligase family protein, partial [Candidatus Eremiobacteraeota bacterium]|nr:class I tRNA ligase family protein [Candidatus Eremiobacteraeota bacterium]
MALRLYNTRTRAVEAFVPMVAGKVSMYVCGMTPSFHPHLGHARTFLTFDVLFRYLRAKGYDVTYVRNVTDIDDRILQRAKERGEGPLELSSRVSDVCDAQLRAIGVRDPDHEPKVSTHIAEIVALIQDLIARGHAYVSKTDKGQDVYFA